MLLLEKVSPFRRPLGRLSQVNLIAYRMTREPILYFITQFPQPPELDQRPPERQFWTLRRSHSKPASQAVL